MLGSTMSKNIGIKSLTIDTTHSTVGFVVRHMVVSKVRGTFGAFKGTIAYDPANIERSVVDVEIDAASIDTREAKRDAHLRSADFFDVEQFPTLTFRSTGVKRTTDDTLAVAGDLTIHGVTRPVTLVVDELGGGKDPWGNDRLAWSGRLAVNRKDFGLNWNQLLEAGGVLVSEKIDIELEIQAF
jgi:polyisoprenoid-binding protein YceI